MHPAAVPVTMTGFSLNSFLLALLNVLFGGTFATVAIALIRNRSTMTTIKNKRETDLLAERADEMKEMRDTIVKLNERLSRSERRSEAHLEIITHLHNEEIAVMRHRLGSESMVNMKLLTAIAAGTPEKLAKIVETIEADKVRRESELAREQTELVKLRAAAADKIEKLRSVE